MIRQISVQTKTTRTTTVTVGLSEIRTVLNIPEGAKLYQIFDDNGLEVCYDRSLEDTHQLVFTYTEIEETSE